MDSGPTAGRLTAAIAAVSLAGMPTGGIAQIDVAPVTVIADRSVIELPPYAALAERPGIARYASESDYDAARNDRRFVFERLEYQSDGLRVVAFHYRNRSDRVDGPAVVFNRGSYVRNGAAPEYLVTFHRFAVAGFEVLAPMYRGSEGAGGLDEMGGADLADLMRILAVADELPSIDVERLYLVGESRGGMMALQAIRDGFPARAAATYGSPTDFFALLEGEPDLYEPLADQLWPDWRDNPEKVLGRRSATAWADRIDVPLLMLHGANDRSMPVAQTLSLAGRLDELGKDFELHVLGHEDHVMSGNAAARDALAIAWFRRHAGDSP